MKSNINIYFIKFLLAFIMITAIIVMIQCGGGGGGGDDDDNGNGIEPQTLEITDVRVTPDPMEPLISRVEFSTDSDEQIEATVTAAAESFARL